MSPSHSARPAARPRLSRRGPARCRPGRRPRRPSAAPTGAGRPGASCWWPCGRGRLRAGRERPGRQPDGVQQPLDPGRLVRRRHADLEADPNRSPQTVGDRLPVEQRAIPGGRLDRVADRMPEVERDPPAGRAALALIGDDDLDLGPAGPLDDLGKGSGREDRGVTSGDRLAIALEQDEQPLVAESCHLDRLAERGPKLALRERPQHRDVDDHCLGLVERSQQVLALGQVDTVLPPIDESIWATRVVGTWRERMRRR